jgi:type I restriction enzyme M protein
METRVHRVLDTQDIEKIAKSYHDWRNPNGRYQDVAGFCKSATKEEIAAHDFVLTPGRYVGTEEIEADDEPLATKINRLTNLLFEQFERSGNLEHEIRRQLKGLQ